MSVFSRSRFGPLATIDDDSYLSLRSLATSEKFPWSPDHICATVLQQCPGAGTRGPAGTGSLSTSSRSSDSHDAGQYFSSGESQYSQSSVEEESALRSPCPGTGASPNYPVKSQVGVCGPQIVLPNDPEVLRTCPKRACDGRQAYSEPLNKDKPLPLLPPMDTASPFSEIACSRSRLLAGPAMRQPSQQRWTSSKTSRSEKSPPGRILLPSNRHRSNAPKLSNSNSRPTLDTARTFYSEDTKNHSIVRHELPIDSDHTGKQVFDTGNVSPISKLIFDLESFPWVTPQVSAEEGSPNPCSSAAASSRCIERSTGSAAYSEGRVGSDCAELIIFNILSQLEIQDLFSAARISRGFYTVMKRKELFLIKHAIFNTSPAAWEYLEQSCKSSNVPKRYVESYRNGMETISILRSSILIRCDAILRQETISGLVRADMEKSRDIDQAFWRIWTFCTMFSHKPGQQRMQQNDHSLAPLDWLKGSRVSSKSASKISNPNYRQALSSAELLDMFEIWSCLANLLYRQISKARKEGLFERYTLDDIYTEEFYMRKWIDNIMTSGLSTIVELSSCSFEDVTASGWLQWLPAANTDMKPFFLGDAIAVAYQHRLLEKAEVEAVKVTLPRKASGRARRARKRCSVSTALPRPQSHDIRRKAIGSPAKKPSVTPLNPISPARPSYHDLHSQIRKNPRLSSIAEIPQRAAATSPVPPANMLQKIRLQSGVSTQIGPTLFTSIPPSARSSLSARSPSSVRSSSSAVSSAFARSPLGATAPQPVSPISPIESTPIAISQPQRVPPRATHLANCTEQAIGELRSRFTSLSQSDPYVGSPTGDYMDRAIGLLVEMGFPLAAVKDALASFEAGSQFQFDTVVAMLASISRKPATLPVPKPAVPCPQPGEVESSPAELSMYQLQVRTASQGTERLGRRTREQKKARERRAGTGLASIDSVRPRGWSFTMPSVVLRALGAGYDGDV